MKLSVICTTEIHYAHSETIQQQGFVVSVYESQSAPTGTECINLCSKGMAL